MRTIWMVICCRQNATSSLLPLALGEHAPNPPQILLAQVLILDHLREQEPGGALEQPGGQVPQGAALCRLARDRSHEAMRASLLLMAHVALLLELLQDRQDRGVRQLILQALL